jgi:hypothetical protein
MVCRLQATSLCFQRVSRAFVRRTTSLSESLSEIADARWRQLGGALLIIHRATKTGDRHGQEEAQAKVLEGSEPRSQKRDAPL